MHAGQRLLRHARRRPGGPRRTTSLPRDLRRGGLQPAESEVAGRAVENESLVNVPNWLPLTSGSRAGPGSDRARWRCSATGRSSTCAGACSPACSACATPTDASTRVTPAPLRQHGPSRTSPALETHGRPRELVGPPRGPLGARRHGDQRRRRPLPGARGTPPRSRSRPARPATTRSSAAGRDEPVPRPDRPAARTRLARDGPGRTSSGALVRGARRIAAYLSSQVDARASRSPSRRWWRCSPRGTAAISEPGAAARGRGRRDARRSTRCWQRHALAWDQLWRRCDIELGRRATAGRSTPAPARLPPAPDRLRAHRSTSTSASRPAGCTARPTGATSSGTSCSSSRSCNLRFPELTRALLRYRYRRLPEARRGGARGRLRGRDVPVAERQRRARGDPATAPQPALGPVAARPLPPPAPRQHRRRLQRLAVLPGHRRPRVPRGLRRRDDARDRPLLGQPRRLQPRPRPLRDPRRDGPRRVPRRLPGPRGARPATTTPTPT